MLVYPSRPRKPRSTLPKGLRPGNHKRQSRATDAGIALSRERHRSRASRASVSAAEPTTASTPIVGPRLSVAALLKELDAIVNTCGHKPHSVLTIATLMELAEAHGDKVSYLRRVEGQRLVKLARQAAGSQKGSVQTLLKAATSIIGAGNDEDGTIAARHLEAGLLRSHSLQPKAGWKSHMGALQSKSAAEFLQEF